MSETSNMVLGANIIHRTQAINAKQSYQTVKRGSGASG